MLVPARAIRQRQYPDLFSKIPVLTSKPVSDRVCTTTNPIINRGSDGIPRNECDTFFDCDTEGHRNDDLARRAECQLRRRELAPAAVPMASGHMDPMRQALGEAPMALRKSLRSPSLGLPKQPRRGARHAWVARPDT